MIKKILNLINLRTLKIVVKQSAINSALGLLWLSVPAVFLSEFKIEKIPLVILGLMIMFYVFVFSPVLICKFI
ncbi:MAG: hypothetical protein H0W73_16320 [Bacteroidetes bacterium]|nr:hypothetical protein [Bacteroidota bacterium]